VCVEDEKEERKRREMERTCAFRRKGKEEIKRKERKSGKMSGEGERGIRIRGKRKGRKEIGCHVSSWGWLREENAIFS
jgi:hypothetical protein